MIAMWAGITLPRLAALVRSPESFCDVLSVPRRRDSKRPRRVYAAREELRLLQRAVALELAKHDHLLGEEVMGFRKRHSIFDNASYHAAHRPEWLLVMDVREFFESISYESVEALLRSPEIGAPKVAAVILARAMTLNGRLVQGSRASPAIANLVGRAIDLRIKNAISDLGVPVRYTRYADDLSISSNTRPDRDLFEQCVEQAGFRVRPNSVRLSPRGTGQYVTGLRIDDGAAQLPRAKRRARERLFHLVARFGVARFAKWNQFKSSKAAENHLNGLIHWARQGDTVVAARWRQNLEEGLAKDSQIPVA
jgi:RNA-directed DNA polymerase